MTTTLKKEEIIDIAYGSALLGSGGGGSFLIWKFFEKYIDEVKLTKIEEIDDNDWSASIFAVAPADVEPPEGMEISSLSLSNLDGFSSHALDSTDPLEEVHKTLNRTFKRLESALLNEGVIKNKLSHILAIDMGTAPLFIAFFVAQENNISIIDCDGAGRAIPILDLTTYSVAIEEGFIPNYPSSISNLLLGSPALEKQKIPDDHFFEAVLHTQDHTVLEPLINDILKGKSLGNAAALASTTINGSYLKAIRPVISGTISQAQVLGRAIRIAIQNKNDLVQEILYFLNNDFDKIQEDRRQAFLIFEGVIEQIEMDKNETRFQSGFVIIKNSNDVVRVIVKNESLLVWSSKKAIPLCMAPDIISYISIPGGEPLTNSDISEGQKVALICINSPQKLRRNKILLKRFLGVLRTLGYGGPYVPIEELMELHKKFENTLDCI